MEEITFTRPRHVEMISETFEVRNLGLTTETIWFGYLCKYSKKWLNNGSHWNHGIQKKLIVRVFLVHLGPNKHVPIPFNSSKKVSDCSAAYN